MTASLAALMLGVWTAEAAAPIPPKCSPPNTQHRAILFSGAFGTGGDGYRRWCGPNRAVLRVGGKSFTIQGGKCGHYGTTRWAHFGLDASGSLPGARSFWVLHEETNRPGRNKIVDSEIQLPGVSFAQKQTGTAIVAKGRKSATFSIGPPGNPTRVTGSWTCG